LFDHLVDQPDAQGLLGVQQAGRKQDIECVAFAYQIDQETGALKYLAKYPTRGVPIWVMCGSVER